MSPRSNRKPALGQRSTSKNTRPLWALNLSPIWLRDTGQRISWYDSCQLNIICMSNIKDICCNPRLHDLVIAGWPPCCATSSSSVIHAASHFYHEKRIAWVSISKHACDHGAPLGRPSGRRSSAIKKGYLVILVVLVLTKEWFVKHGCSSYP